MLAENARVLRVQAEHQTHTELVQVLERFRVFRVLILLQQPIVQQTDDLAGLDGDLHLPLQMHISLVHKERQTVIFLFQIGQLDLLGIAVGLLHVIDIKLLEVAGDDPTRVLGERQLRDVFLGLLEGIEHRAVRLPDGLVQILPGALLLDHDFRLGDIAVDKAGGAVQLHLVFKSDELFRLDHTKDVTKQSEPKLLAFSLLISFAFPIFRKGFCRGFLLCFGQRHRNHLKKNPAAIISQLY